jgi:hypothetical protein
MKRCPGRTWMWSQCPVKIRLLYMSPNSKRIRRNSYRTNNSDLTSFLTKPIAVSWFTNSQQSLLSKQFSMAGWQHDLHMGRPEVARPLQWVVTSWGRHKTARKESTSWLQKVALSSSTNLIIRSWTWWYLQAFSALQFQDLRFVGEQNWTGYA